MTAEMLACLTGLRVLLAEDHPVNQKVVQLILGAAGVELAIADNGALGVDAWRRVSGSSLPARVAGRRFEALRFL